MVTEEALPPLTVGEITDLYAKYQVAMMDMTRLTEHMQCVNELQLGQADETAQLLIAEMERVTRIAATLEAYKKSNRLLYKLGVNFYFNRISEME